MQRLEQNQHLLDFEVEVLPELRRQGLGRRLLAPVAVLDVIEGAVARTATPP